MKRIIVDLDDKVLVGLSSYDEFDETRADFSRWKGIYETWRRRKQSYTEQIGQRELAETLRLQPAY